MNIKNYHIIIDPVYSYRRLDPLPTSNDISRFYQSRYYDLIRQGGRAPELRRLTEGGQEAERERAWLHAALYTDIVHILKQYAPGTRVLDVGCGTGEMVAFLAKDGFDPVGIEPASEAVALAHSLGRSSVKAATLEEYAEYSMKNNIRPFDVIVLLNVLEHVIDPVHIIEVAKGLLSADGIIYIRVPNDFTELQAAAQAKLGCSPWWVAVPDHINYFDFSSLTTLLNRLGLEVIHATTDFPMELFLLMGEIYVGNPEIGSACHKKRVNFEMSIPADLRRNIYQALAKVGVGRSCMLFARKLRQE